MARNKKPAENAAPKTEGEEQPDELFDETEEGEETTPGGALGLPDNALEAVKQTVGGQQLGTALVKETAGAPKAKHYRVIQGGFIMFQGCKTRVPTGKLLDDVSTDVDYLQLQGIILEEVVRK